MAAPRLKRPPRPRSVSAREAQKTVGDFGTDKEKLTVFMESSFLIASVACLVRLWQVLQAFWYIATMHYISLIEMRVTGFSLFGKLISNVRDPQGEA